MVKEKKIWGCQECQGIGRGIALTNTSISRVGLLEKATLEQRLKGGEVASLADVKGKRVPDRAQSQAEALDRSLTGSQGGGVQAAKWKMGGDEERESWWGRRGDGFVRLLVLGLYKYPVFLLLIFPPPTIISEAFSVSFHPLLYPVYGRIESNSPSDVSLTNGAKTTFCEKENRERYKSDNFIFGISRLSQHLFFLIPLPHISA